MSKFVAVVSVLLCSVVARAQQVIIDDFVAIDEWQVIEADGVKLHTAAVEGPGHSHAMRLEYDFSRGSGYCVVRKNVDLDLPENYAFTFSVRGQGPANNLEFKLVSPSGDDVWWVNRRAFVPPRDWTVLRNKRRHFEFAWGPSGGAPMKRIGAIEIAVSSSEGGTGVIEIEELSFESLPLTSEPADARAVLMTAEGTDPDATLTLLGEMQADQVNWKPETGKPQQLVVEFERPVEFGAIELEWAEQSVPTEYSVAIDDQAISDARRIQTNDSRRQHLFMPESEGSKIRIAIDAPATCAKPNFELTSVQLVPVSEASSANAYWTRVARRSPGGVFPRSMLGLRSAWTVIGLPDGQHEAIMSETGAVETMKGGWSIEPVLIADGWAHSWDKATITRTLLDGHLPAPTVRWDLNTGLRLEVTALVDGEPGEARLAVRYRVTHLWNLHRNVGLALVAEPFQVLPPSQWLNVVGGFTPLREVRATEHGLILNAGPAIQVSKRPYEYTVGSLATDGPASALRRIELEDAPASDPAGELAAAMRFGFVLGPGESSDVILTASIGGQHPVKPMDPAEFEAALDAVREQWTPLINSPQFVLPGGEDLVDTYRTAIAHILINRDGPSIQPGSRTYERSWIRDGALTSLALILAGQGERAREFVEWYAPFQYESGKVPCVVDHRGPDPVDEHDSTGELIFAIRNAAAATGDTELLQRLYPHVVDGVAYLQSLRARRQTREYTESDDPIRQACVGLVPESISHEGYSAKPMHSYWDNFWVLRGFQDAAAIARAIGKPDDAARFAAIADDFRRDLVRSIGLSAARTGATFIPGCVELGDFDATSTSIAVAPLDEMSQLPEELLQGTFERYWESLIARRDGLEPWEGMTPYEVRIVGTMVRLGWAERAHATLDWLMTLRSPPGWNQWGEIAYRDPEPGRFIGDMPHTWVASGFVLSFLSMFGYEHEGAVVVAPALDPAWVDAGMSVSGLWTRYGPLSYRASRENGMLVILLEQTPNAPNGLLLRATRTVLVDGVQIEPLNGFVELPAQATRVELKESDE